MTNQGDFRNDNLFRLRARPSQPYLRAAAGVLPVADPHRGAAALSFIARAIEAASYWLPFEEQAAILARWIADGEFDKAVPREDLDTLRRRWLNLDRLTRLEFADE